MKYQILEYAGGAYYFADNKKGGVWLGSWLHASCYDKATALAKLAYLHKRFNPGAVIVPAYGAKL
jgi:hypothetical protein